MSISISRHRMAPRHTQRTAVHARAEAMANSLVPNYLELLGTCTSANEVSALLHGPQHANPRLRIESLSDTAVRVSLRHEPKDIPLLTIHARP